MENKVKLQCQDCHRSKRIVSDGHEFNVDLCIADVVEALGRHPAITTSSCCCGHGATKASILINHNLIGYMLVEIDLKDPLGTWERYRPGHEKMMREQGR